MCRRAVLDVRRRQLRNAMCLLLLAHGVPMFVAGDEFARTQHGNNNPYNQDNETSWIDWCRRDEFARPRGLRRSSPRVPGRASDRVVRAELVG